MKAGTVRVGKTYAVKVGERIVPVLLTTRNTFGGGWTGLNRFSGREVRVRTAARCRYEMEWNPETKKWQHKKEVGEGTSNE